MNRRPVSPGRRTAAGRKSVIGTRLGKAGAAALLLAASCAFTAPAFAQTSGAAGRVESAPAEQASAVTVYRVGKIITCDDDDRVINNGVVIVRDGKIERLGKAKDIEAPEGAKTVDMPQAWLVPGLIDCHNHTAGSLSDLNDMVYLTNPGLRTLDTVDVNSENFKRAPMGGVTTVLLIPGSGTNLSGFGTVVKFAGDTPEEAVIRSPGSIKIAQAGNPERYWYGVGRQFMNFNTRQTLEKARDYHLAWQAFEAGETDEEPEYDPTFDGFRDLYRREFPASVHTQAFQVVMTTVDMLGRKLKVRTVLDHSTFDAWKTAPLVLEAGEDNIITITGPRCFRPDFSQRKIMGNTARWWQGGITKLGVNTDAPVVPQEELSLQAAMGCWYGWKPYEALKGLTSVPAEALMVDDRVGRIAEGYDADFGLWTGDPVDPRSACLLTVINGEVVHDGRESRRF